MKKIIISSLLTLFLFACKNADEPSSALATENINPAANNDAVIAQQKFYISGQSKSSVYQFVPNNNGHIYFYGNDGVIGEVDNIGSLIWAKTVGYVVKEMKIVSGYLVTVGNPVTSSSSIKFKDTQKVSSFDGSGNLVGDLTITLPNYKIGLSSLASEYEEYQGLIKPLVNKNVSIIPIKIAGSAYNGTNYFPYFFDINIEKSTGKLSLVAGSNLIISSLINFHCRDFAVKSSGTEGVKYVALYSQYESADMDAGTSKVLLAKYDSNMQELWNKELKGENGLKFFPNELFIQNNYADNDPIYVVGITEAGSKAKTSSGKYWDSGYIYSITGNGTINFQKTIEYTVKSESLHDICFSLDGYIYLCGEHSKYYYTDKTKAYGNGMAIKMDRSGNIQKLWTIGDKTTLSGFNTICLSGNNLLLGGYTYENYADSKFKNWTVVIAK